MVLVFDRAWWMCVREQLYACLAIERAALDFLDDPGPAQTAQLQIVSTVVEPLVPDNPPEAADLGNGRLSFVVPLPARAQQHQRDQTIARQGVGRHLPITLLEDVQALNDRRKQHQVRQ